MCTVMRKDMETDLLAQEIQNMSSAFFFLLLFFIPSHVDEYTMPLTNLHSVLYANSI